MDPGELLSLQICPWAHVHPRSLNNGNVVFPPALQTSFFSAARKFLIAKVSNFTIGIFASTYIIFQGGKALEDLRRVHALRQCRRHGRRRGALAQLLLRANTAWQRERPLRKPPQDGPLVKKWGGKTQHISISKVITLGKPIWSYLQGHL